MEEDRKRRIGRNEALFREVNERVEALSGTFTSTEQPMQLLCECGNESCFEKVELTREEYERLRADSATFAIIPGHEEPDVETVVEEHERYVIVRKRPGEPEQIAEQLDPRS